MMKQSEPLRFPPDFPEFLSRELRDRQDYMFYRDDRSELLQIANDILKTRTSCHGSWPYVLENLYIEIGNACEVADFFERFIQEIDYWNTNFESIKPRPTEADIRQTIAEIRKTIDKLSKQLSDSKYLFPWITENGLNTLQYLNDELTRFTTRSADLPVKLNHPNAKALFLATSAKRYLKQYTHKSMNRIVTDLINAVCPDALSEEAVKKIR